MKIKKYGAQSRFEVQGAGEVYVLVSYATPVAAFVQGAGYLVTDRKYSVTTSRHVKTWLRENGYPKTSPASSERLRELYERCCGRSAAPALPQPEH